MLNFKYSFINYLKNFSYPQSSYMKTGCQVALSLSPVPNVFLITGKTVLNSKVNVFAAQLLQLYNSTNLPEGTDSLQITDCMDQSDKTTEYVSQQMQAIGQVSSDSKEVHGLDKKLYYP